jgi:uncharacterized protein
VACFVDTSCWFAAVNRLDRLHDQATRILKSEQRLITSDYVVQETWRLLHHRTGWKTAERFWKSIRDGIATMELVAPPDLERAWVIGTQFEDQEFSLTDRTSFSLMLRTGVSRVATFDSDFAIFRFGNKGSDAFELVR